MAIGSTFDPKYKMRYRPASVSRLSKYARLPPPMADDPPEAAKARDWDERCHIVYRYMMDLKAGKIPPSRRRGLWMYAA
jgi:hypothetical protein